VSTGQETWTCAGDLSAVPPLPPIAAAAPLPFPTWTEWQVEHARAVAQSVLPAAVSATDVAHGRAPVELPSVALAGLAKQPRDLELPPWAKGRYGTAVGRAVHAVLQTVSFATGDGVDALSESLAHAEGVGEHSAVVAAMSRSALASAVVGRAAVRDHGKETYVGTIIDDVLVEGYVDLLYREDDGRLVIVDYKTDAAPTEETVRAYATQLSLYARAIQDATGDSTDCVLVFCAVDSPATELWLPL
jgi:ATP-dependent helicase/nuclease subunit A